MTLETLSKPAFIIGDGSISAESIVNTQVDKGSVGTGTVTFTVSEARYQKLTVTGPLTIAFDGWPASGTHGEVEIELVNGDTDVTWPVVNWYLGDGSTSTTFDDMSITLSAAGTNTVVVWSTDGGTTLYGVAA